MIDKRVSWEVFYYEGGLPLITRSSSENTWDDLPEDGVIWVDVHFEGKSIRMGGMDYYWVDGLSCGVFNSPENYDWYEGNQILRWTWVPGENQTRDYEKPNKNVKILTGIMIPDDEAQKLGLI